MFFGIVKKGFASLALALLILSSGVSGNAVALAANGHLGGQDRDWNSRRPTRDERERFRREEREELRRIREMDRNRRLRYQMNNRVRTVGYFDRLGNYHQYGYYDRWGYFHRY